MTFLKITRRDIKLNSIDALGKNLFINVEKKCRQFRTCEVDYSLDTAQAGFLWYFWKLLLKHKLRKKIVLENYLPCQINSTFQIFTQCQ